MLVLLPLIRSVPLGGSIFSSSNPSEPEARGQFEAAVEATSNGTLKVVSFEKTNGIPAGEGKYKVEYKAVILCVRDCRWTCWLSYADSPHGYQAISLEEEYQTWAKTPAPFRQDKRTFDSIIASYHCSKSGERTTVFGTLPFERTENGWRLIPRERLEDYVGR
jgi:hypothetical protein